MTNFEFDIKKMNVNKDFKEKIVHKKKSNIFQKFIDKLRYELNFLVIIFFLTALIGLIVVMSLKNKDFSNYSDTEVKNFQERVIERIKNNELTDIDREALSGIDDETVKIFKEFFKE